MQENRPSVTALGVAIRRAAHQSQHRPLVFEDPLAVRIVGDAPWTYPDALAIPTRKDLERGLDALVVARSRYTEDALEACFQRGIRQYVILGAGLDTSGYRNPHASLRVFEVDHPATQGWKRERLAAAEIAVPPWLTFAPVDFETQTLADGLGRADFDFEAPAFFSWLGVTIYLSHPAILETLRLVARLPAGSEIVCDFGSTELAATEENRATFDAIAQRLAQVGEPMITLLDPAETRRELLQMGFRHVDVLSPDDINARYFRDRTDGLAMTGIAQLLHARV